MVDNQILHKSDLRNKIKGNGRMLPKSKLTYDI